LWRQVHSTVPSAHFQQGIATALPDADKSSCTFDSKRSSRYQLIAAHAPLMDM
jgi:hypothetical protein